MDVGNYKPSERFLRSEEAPVDEQLFPRIPDEITWTLIAPKLSWRAVPILAAVSRAWKEAIRTNRVYEARVRANSRETLIIHFHSPGIAALYSTSENCCYELPPIPHLPKRVLESCKCIALGGKIYIFGGLDVLQGKIPSHDDRCMERIVSGRVYVLDLGRGQWQWEQCASMLDPRFSLGMVLLTIRFMYSRVEQRS